MPRGNESTIKPFPWQEASIKTLVSALRRERGVIDASDVGTGKSFMSLFAAKELGLPVAIICPKSLVLQWKEVCGLVGVKPLYIINYEKAVLGFEHGRWLNSKMYEWTLKTPHILIADEAHRLRNYKTRTCTMFESGANHGAGFKLLAMSATLAEDPLHFKAIGRWLNLFPRGGFWPWAQVNGVFKEGFGYRFTSNMELRKEFLLRLHRQLFPWKGSRIRVAEIPDFPDQVVNFVPANVDEKSYAKVEKQIEELRLKAMDDAPLPIVELLRARQEMELLKVKSIIEIASDAVADGTSVAIFLEFLDTIKAVTEGLSDLKPLVLTGEDNDPSVREAARIAFQNNEREVIILQSRVGGVGLSLHDLKGKPRMSIISPSYSATTFKQVLGRIRRAGGKSPAIQNIIYVPQSVEARVIRAVKNKMNNLDLLWDGDLSYFNETEKHG